MADELDDKIKQISEMLKKDELPDNLKNIINIFKDKSDNSSQNPPQEGSDREAAEKSSAPALPMDDDTFQKIFRIKKLLETNKSEPDPKVTLLNAIKPFLKDERQKKVANSIKFLNISKITKMIDFGDFI